MTLSPIWFANAVGYPGFKFFDDMTVSVKLPPSIKYIPNSNSFEIRQKGWFLQGIGPG